MFLAWFLGSYLSGPTLIAKIHLPGKIIQVLLDGTSSNLGRSELPRW